ncbi:MAG: HAD-IC family P-type ATPase [Methanosarcinaceae archaeon]|nr:HAD-IC family P-type ATPase [Methanosarcinaceae archaeon]
MTKWYSFVSDEVFEKLDTSSEGLSISQAEERLRRYGKNEIVGEKKETWLKVFLRQFANVLIVILIIAAIVSFAIGEVVDAGTILIIVLLNSVLGFTQEWKAEKAIEALKRMLGQRSTVVRGGESVEIDSALIVPGDVVLLEMGEKLPADIYIFESNSLAMDEAPLTGESTPVEKNVGTVAEDTILVERSNIGFMGTTIANGWGKGVVIATGMNTEFGKIAGLAQEVEEEETPLAKRLNVLGKRIGEIALVIAGLAILVGLIQQRDLVEMFFIGVSLAVAVIPEGLPAVVTLTLALGIKNMARRNCLIRRLPASETLGSASVICTDKTGTLTKNEMTVKSIYVPGSTFEVTGSGYEPKGDFRIFGGSVSPDDHPDLIRFLKAGLLCSHATLARSENNWRIMGAPTEGALVVAAHKAGLFKKDITSPQSPAVTEFSFNSVRKRMTVIYPNGGKKTAYVKGAPEMILEHSTKQLVDGKPAEMSETEKRKLHKIYEEFAAKGLRVLAVAYRELPEHIEITPDSVENDLVFLGFAGIVDPPRPEVRDAVKLCNSAGIDVIMMTGDSPLTAWAVAEDIGLKSSGTLQGTDIDKISDYELRDALLETRILARVSPAHKLRVIEILREGEYTIAMTGDGVNDAPALKRANIGIAMGIKGTDVAKEASDMVLVDDNFASIVSGVEEGRREYDNILKFTRYLLSSNFGEIIAITGAILLNMPLILLPVQILWMNLVTDGLTALALGLEPAEKDVMRQQPRDPKQPILSKGAFAAISLIGLWIGAATIYVFSHNGMDLDKARTMAFTGIIIFEKINVLNFRSFRYPLRDVKFWSNPYLLVAIAGTIGLQALAVYMPFLQAMLRTVPLEFGDWMMLLIIGLPLLIAGELYKAIRVSKQKI